MASRTAQGIVTGIGLLGGGVILQTGKVRDVKVLATAAAMWLTAALGLLCGIGELKLAIGAAVPAVLLLQLVNVLQTWRAKSDAGPDRPSRD